MKTTIGPALGHLGLAFFRGGPFSVSATVNRFTVADALRCPLRYRNGRLSGRSATELPWRAKTVPATEANYATLRKFISVVVRLTVIVT